jgi:hypothetical protein
MLLPEYTSLLRLLITIHNRTIRDYFYFPDVVLADHQRIDKDDFFYLKQEGYIEEYSHDSFGRFYRASAKARQLIQQVFAVKQGIKRKRIKIKSMQGSLCF